MAKVEPPIDVLVLGDHPATYLAAALVSLNARVRVVHSTIPGNPESNRLVIVNPELFDLHPIVQSIRRKVEMTPLYGVQFLSDDPATRSEFRSKAAVAHVSTYKSVRAAMIKLAAEHDVEMLTPKELQIHRLDEKGAEVTAGKRQLRPRAILLGNEVPESQAKLLGLPDSWGTDVVHRYTYIKLNSPKWAELGPRPLMPMSLNLHEMYCWGWLIPGERCVQIAVEQPVETLGRVRPAELLASWVAVLRQHGVINGKADPPLESAEWMDLPLAGALAHEGVANRTLLIGPAGGFYSACSEDIYPNCWSAVFAADAIKKALRETHLQDALQPYRHKWRTSLGEYLRGPQQNLRFLLPLVYRNPKMTTRLAESILQGKSVVRN